MLLLLYKCYTLNVLGQDDDKTLNLTEIKSSSSLRYRPISLYCTIHKVFTTLNIFSSLLSALKIYARTLNCCYCIRGMHAYKRYNKLKLLISEIYFILFWFVSQSFFVIFYTIFMLHKGNRIGLGWFYFVYWRNTSLSFEFCKRDK